MAKALVIAAPQSGSGKTVLTLALLRAFRNRGLIVASAKVGPDYIDPRFHEAASGRPCFNLDPWAMGKPLIRNLLSSLAESADLVIIEGVMGLFDGPSGARGSTADLAEDLGLPVVLVIDASRQSQSVAALVHGFTTFRPSVNVAGVILNRVASKRHDRLLRETLPGKVLGAVRRSAALDLPSRHLGLVQAEENQQLEEFIETAAAAVSCETDFNRLLTIASQLTDESGDLPAIRPLGQRIAVARDAAFAFIYPHLLQQWREAGAEILPFSPLNEEAPDASCDAVFLPGGYPELHAGRLAANHGFLAGLKASKGLVYGECGGFMVLGEELIDGEGHRHRMAGLLPVVTSFATRKLSLGYRTLMPLPGAPWSKPMRGHEFHYSTISSEGYAERLFAASDAAGHDLGQIGMRRGQVMGSYAHVIAEAP